MSKSFSLRRRETSDPGLGSASGSRFDDNSRSLRSQPATLPIMTLLATLFLIPPSQSRNALARQKYLIVREYYERVWILRARTRVCVHHGLPVHLAHMHPPGKAGWYHRELAKEAGSRWPIKQQQHTIIVLRSPITQLTIQLREYAYYIITSSYAYY